MPGNMFSVLVGLRVQKKQTIRLVMGYQLAFFSHLPCKNQCKEVVQGN